jgi:hypothetical protein
MNDASPCRCRSLGLAILGAAVILAIGTALSGGIYTFVASDAGAARMNRWTGTTWTGVGGAWEKVPEGK